MENNNKKDNFRQFNAENFNQTTEEDVGIIEFINKEHEAFECVLKHRYSDFLVNEISDNGNVVWLKMKSEAGITTEQPKNQVGNEPKIEDKIRVEKLNTEKANNVTVQNNNINKLVLNSEMVKDIIRTSFVGQQIIDEEDGQKLKDLVIKYIER